MNSVLTRLQRGGNTHRSAVEDRKISKLAVAAVAFVMLVVGVFLGGGLMDLIRSDSTAQAPTVVTAPKGSRSVDAGPSHFEGMVPVGYLHNEDGARAAAQAFAAMTTEMLFRPDSDARAAARMSATPASADVVEASIMAPINGIRQSFAIAAQSNPNGRALVRTIPIGSRTVSYSPERARIDVWALTLIAIEIDVNAAVDGAPTRALFTTTSYALEWTNGDWRIAETNQVADSGPALARQAALNPTSFIDQASVFTPFRYQPNRGAQ